MKDVGIKLSFIMTTIVGHCWFNDVFVPGQVTLLKVKFEEKKGGISHISKCSSQSASQYNGIVCLWCLSRANSENLMNQKWQKNWMCLHCRIHLYSRDKKIIQTKWKPLGVWIWLFWYLCGTAEFGEHHNSNCEINGTTVVNKKSQNKYWIKHFECWGRLGMVVTRVSNQEQVMKSPDSL